MTRLQALVCSCAMLVLAVVASGCMSSQAPAPTPDPFAGLSDRSDQAFRQGLEAYGQGQYREALTAFEQARTLSPVADTRIDQMIERTKAAMAPTPTPVPPTPTELPATPTAVPVLMSDLAPDSELGVRYFGLVTLAVVPGKDGDAPASTQFFFQDQIGLHIEGLKQHLRLPFTLRVFNADTKQLVAQVVSDQLVAQTKPDAAPTKPAAGSSSASAAATAVATSTKSPASEVAGNQLARFWDSYVWYHQGGEDPGRYRAELYANGILTHTFDYLVVNVPVATPTAEPQVAVESPTAEPTATEPTIVDVVPTLAPPPVVSTRPQSAPAAPSAPVVAPVPQVPTPEPSPTPIPTPATAGETVIGGLPAGLDVNPSTGRLFIADGSGVIWANDPSRPTNFNRPVDINRLPVDLAVDWSTGNVFVSARNESSVLVLDQSGRQLSSIAMPVAPGDLQVDSELGLVFVVLPGDQSIGVIDGRGGRLLWTIPNLPQITSLALDPARHVLYASHLGGQLSVIDGHSSQVMARMNLTGVGLESVATARGLAYAINTSTHELVVAEHVGQTATHYVLPAEPAAVAASEDSGSVYVLASRPNTVLRIDPTDGTIVGQVTLHDRGGRFGISVSDPAAFQGLRSRMVLNPADQSLFVSLPEAGSLSIVPTDLFPPLGYPIPWVAVPDAPVVASIPGVIRPGAPPLPDQPAPMSANAASQPSEEAN